jgi:hypothetical protein
MEGKFQKGGCKSKECNREERGKEKENEQADRKRDIFKRRSKLSHFFLLQNRPADK